MDRYSVSTMLRDLADVPAPPPSMDIARAAAAGRRRLRVRRLMTGGSATAGVAAVVAVVGVLATGTPTAGPAPAPVGSGETGNSVSPSPPMPAAAPQQFDPMVQYAAFGWQPDGSTGHGVSAGRDWLLVSADYHGLPTGDGDEPSPAGVYLMMVPAGNGIDATQFVDFAVDPGRMLPGTEAEPVNGRRAEWVAAIGTILRWEYAPDAWAAVFVSGNLPGVDSREVARRVAENVRYGVETRVTLPFSTTGVPPELPIAKVEVQQYAGGWSATVSYGTGRTQYLDWPLVILAGSSDHETGDGAVIGDPTTTVDGHPARTSSLLDGGSALQVFNVDGVYVELTTHSAETTALLPDGLVQLFRATEFYANPADWR